MLNFQPGGGAVKDLRTIYRVDRTKPLVSFKMNRLTSLNQYPVTVDKHGNKLGFGNDLAYYTIQQDFKREQQNRLALYSRGTVLKMMSDTDSEINAVVADIQEKPTRQISQPPIPRAFSLLDNRLQKKSAPNLPAITSKSRLNTPAYVGEEAYSHFYRKYKRLSKEKEISPNGYSATTAYLTSCEKNQMVPTPMGIIKWDGDETEINVENYLMGKKYAMALSNSMKYLKTEKLNLQSNNLGSSGSAAILSNLCDNLTELDLAKNNMGDEAMPKLVSWLEGLAGKCKLKYLNLAANKLSDEALRDL